jgi:hypothetical protein
MPFLSAKPLTDDPKGLSRLKAVISTDPGYDARARHAAEAVPSGSSADVQPQAEQGRAKAQQCETLNATGAEQTSQGLARLGALVGMGVLTIATSAASGLAPLAGSLKDGSSAIG